MKSQFIAGNRGIINTLVVFIFAVGIWHVPQSAFAQKKRHVIPGTTDNEGRRRPEPPAEPSEKLDNYVERLKSVVGTNGNYVVRVGTNIFQTTPKSRIMVNTAQAEMSDCVIGQYCAVTYVREGGKLTVRILNSVDNRLPNQRPALKNKGGGGIKG